MQVYEHILIYGHGLMKLCYQKNLLYVAMDEQEQARKHTTRPRKGRSIHDDNKLSKVKDKNFDAYQKVVRSISHRVI